MRDLPASAPEDERPDRRLAAAANLHVLDALLKVDSNDAGFARLFAALDTLFGFDQALLLENDGAGLRCLVAEPAQPPGRSWPGASLNEVIGGRVLSSEHHADQPAWTALPPDLVAPGQPALAFPVAVADRRVVALLLRAPGAAPFGDADAAAARCAAVVALAGLAMRSGDQLESEIQRLNLLVEQLRQSEQSAQQDYGLIRDILDWLPCGITVRDDQGHPLLVNSAAAAVPVDEKVAQRRLRQLVTTHGEGASVTEETVAGEGGERTWLTSHRPVRVLDQTLLLSSATDITERKRIENEWTRRAYFDDLTGLPNRLYLQDQVEIIVRRADGNGRFALAFIDIDNFKHVNDYYSHAVGDALLVRVAARIGSHLRDSDVLARISGDEFLLLLDPIDNADHARAIVDRILVDMKQPFHVDTYEIFTSASIGVSLHPEHGQSYEVLRRNADNAMYRVKSGTKGEALFFDPESGRSITARMEHEQQLRLAIRDNRFCCAFQPKLDIYSQQVVGFESLVRWRDENGENRSPGTFVGLAIELGLIDVITHFILEQTLQSIERLDESFGAGTSFSVNVPAKLAGDPNFMRPFIDVLRSSGRAERMMLELTEDTFVATNPFQTQVLPMLRDIGTRISIDDFGTGYSCLAALADITADELKVDRSFITDIHQRPRSQSVLKSIESLGLALGMTITAEGVETIAELAYLQEATRIRYAQGFYFCRPFFLEDASLVRKTANRGGEAAREGLEGNRIRSARGRPS